VLPFLQTISLPICHERFVNFSPSERPDDYFLAKEGAIDADQLILVSVMGRMVAEIDDGETVPLLFILLNLLDL
jgi:hypothetical protein